MTHTHEDPHADIRDREELDDPLPPRPQPNCVTAFVIVMGADGSSSVHTYDGHDLRPHRDPTIHDVLQATQALKFEAERTILVDSLVTALTPKPAPATAADVVAEALARRAAEA